MNSTPGYTLLDNASLEGRNTFRVPARAALLADVDDGAALERLFDAEPLLQMAPVLVLGEGSNILFAGDVDGPVVAIRSHGIRILSDDGTTAHVRVDAGANWNDFVRWSIGRGFTGLENLSLIPGTVGAGPIQNIGAYGVELAEFVHAVEAYDRGIGRVRTLQRDDCAFGYRDSLFKRNPDTWIVLAVTFALRRDRPPTLDYAGVREELARIGAEADPRASQVAEAVIRLRTAKLPDPAVIGNAGSFFKNPVVPAVLAAELRERFPGLPVFPASNAGAAGAPGGRAFGHVSVPDGAVANAPTQASTDASAPGVDHAAKLSAAWMIEHCGWKGRRDGDAGVSAQHALVLVNHGRATGADLLALARAITADVHTRFGVTLDPEPRIIGTPTP